MIARMFYKHILHPVLENIAKFRDRNAFCIDGKFHTYDDFGKTVSKIRTAITGAEFVNKDVGLVLNDDLETYASVFALWLEGCSYVPLHSQWPLERCLDIAEQVGFDLVLDSSDTTRYKGNVIMTRKLPASEDNLSYAEMLKMMTTHTSFLPPEVRENPKVFS